MNYIDLFAGAGGLSEGFIREGFNPIAHVEMNKEAADTLRTRLAFHYLNDNNKVSKYYSYLKGKIIRSILESRKNLVFFRNNQILLRKTPINL